MPSEVGREPPCGGSRPAQAKGLSVRRGRHSGHTVWTQSQAHGGNLTGRRATGITTPSRGVYERAFEPREVCGKVLWGQAMAANRTRESRLSGMRGGLAET